VALSVVGGDESGAGCYCHMEKMKMTIYFYLFFPSFYNGDE
jgi:hypothetical protein